MEVPLDQVVHADCLEALRAWPPAVFDLAYLDPPFNTGRTVRGPGGGPSYPDRWTSVVAYLSFLRPRLAAVRRSLKPHGSILLHCDWRTSHHLRLELDSLFGPRRFVNHLVWVYGLGGSSPRRFARKHDDILFYTRGEGYFFDPPLVPATSQRLKGRLKKATDVIEIPSINNMAAERVGYPTQKPLKLLEVLVRACCPPGGVVADPFCGSGTTLVAARGAGRRFVGIDVSAAAVNLTRSRLAAQNPPRRITSRLCGNG